MTKLALATSLFLIACGGSSQESAEPAAPAAAPADAADAEPQPAAPSAESAEPAASEASYEQNAEKVMSFSRQFAAIVVANKDDCDQMGAELQKLADDNQQFIEDAKAFDSDPGFRAYLEKNHKAELEAEMKPAAAPLEGCIKSSAKVREALQSLFS